MIPLDFKKLMMRILLVVSLVIIGFESWCQRHQMSELTLSNNTYSLNGSPYSGKVYDLYDSGQLKEEFEVSAGVMNGQKFTFFRDNRFKKENYQDSVLMYSLEEDLGKLNTILTNLKKDSSNYRHSQDSLRFVFGEKYYKLRVKYVKGKLRGKKLLQYEEYLSWSNKVDKKTKEITEYSVQRQDLQNNLNTEKNKQVYSNKTEESFTYSKGILNGEYKRYNNNMSIVEQGEFSNGKKNGPWITFSNNGKTIYTYQQDIKEGKYEKYTGGIIVSEGNYSNDLMNGEWVFRWDNGNLKGRGEYIDSDGSDKGETDISRNGRHGFWVFHHENGQKAQALSYKYGQLEGEFLSFYTDGNLKEKKYFSNGLLEGEYKIYNKNGQLVLLKFYSKGIINGDCTYWYESGVKSYIYRWKNGKKEGIAESYYENGSLMWKRNFSNDKLKGEQLEYYDTGELEFRYYSIEDKRDKTKKTTRYYKNGKVWYEGYAGDKDKEWYGEQREYYENGKLKRIDVYDNSGTGKILSTINFDINGKEIKQKSVNEEFGSLAGRTKLLDKIKEKIDFTSPSSVKPLRFCFVDKNNSSDAIYGNPYPSNYKGTFVVILDAQNTFGVYLRSTCWIDIYLTGDGTYGFFNVRHRKGEKGYVGILNMPEEDRYPYNWQPFY
jgi:antitoxin component YwqK of YwqJK toxin-antitoxin module